MLWQKNMQLIDANVIIKKINRMLCIRFICIPIN